MGMGACCGIAYMLCQPALKPGPMMPLSMAPALAPPQTLCSGSLPHRLYAQEIC